MPASSPHDPDRRTTPVAAPPPASATAELLERIAKRQAAEPSLSYQQASDLVLGEDPALYRAYTAAMRLPQPRGPQVTKREAPSYEQILKAADLRKASRPGMTRGEALFELGQEHPNEPEYYEAYRRHHVSDEGLRDHNAARLAKYTTGTAS
jgi:hypothetical protein